MSRIGFDGLAVYRNARTANSVSTGRVAQQDVGVYDAAALGSPSVYHLKTALRRCGRAVDYFKAFEIGGSEV